MRKMTVMPISFKDANGENDLDRICEEGEEVAIERLSQRLNRIIGGNEGFRAVRNIEVTHKYCENKMMEIIIKFPKTKFELKFMCKEKFWGDAEDYLSDSLLDASKKPIVPTIILDDKTKQTVKS